MDKTEVSNSTILVVIKTPAGAFRTSEDLQAYTDQLNEWRDKNPGVPPFLVLHPGFDCEVVNGAEPEPEQKWELLEESN